MTKISTLLLLCLVWSLRLSAQYSSVTPIDDLIIDAGIGTSDKSQSKVFVHDGKQWAALANSTGTHLYRLDDKTWTHIMRLSTKKGRTDCVVAGNVVHIFLYQKTSSQLISLEYVPSSSTFQPWASRRSLIEFPFNGEIQTATIDVDGQGRMWLAYVRLGNVMVQWSDAPYSSWSAPHILDSSVKRDDIATVVAMQGQVGVLWSNQNTMRWGFKTHANGASPTSWSADEVPASQSALNIGYGMADDHMNVKMASDGTLYCAIKTGYNNADYPLIGLLVRRPSGSWDNLYDVSRSGTTPIVVLNEVVGKLRVIYSAQTYGGDILYNESPMSSINFGPQHTLQAGASFRDPSSSKQSHSGGGLVIFADAARSVAAGLLVSDQPAPPVPVPVPAKLSLVAPGNGTTGIALNPTLQWNSADGATSYAVQVATNASFSPTLASQTVSEATSLQLSGLGYNTAHYWRVQALNSSGASEWSDTWAFTTLAQQPEPPQEPEPPVSATLVGHWKMNEGGGAVLLDASGYGNNAQIQNTSGVQWVPGKEGMALELPGTLRRFGVVPNHSSLNITKAITIAAWIRPNISKSRAVLGKVYPNGYHLGTSGSGKIEFWFNYESDGSKYRLLSNADHPIDGRTWIHVAATYDGQTARIYINGVEDNAATYSASPTIGTNNSVLMIGALLEDNRWNGALDDVRLYNGALDANAIRGIYAGSAALLSASQGASLQVASTELQEPTERLSVYPNPFVQSATVRFTTDRDESYTITLYDSKGAQIRRLPSGNSMAGQLNSVQVDGTGLNKGLYLLRLQTGSGETSTIRIVLSN